ncbi:MAG: sulfatase [Verrucomicrobiales bacterium]|nr:sulfatase [Verrucomicrobiales bacterium]
MRFHQVARLALGMLSAWACAAQSAERPNFLFIISEDMSPNLGCYGDPDAITPNLDRFAAESLRFTRAYSATGVCATSRSSIITGMHPSSIGTQHMRSLIQLPANVRPFPALLREAGYYCINRAKQDFNFATPADTWDVAGGNTVDGSGRKPGQPFFAIFNFSDTHESRLWPDSQTRMVDQTLLSDAQRHDPAKVHLPNWLPDETAVRGEWARYQDLINLMDTQYIGPLLRQMEEDGSAEDTIVFFFSDHGAPFPRAKQWITEAGTRVPLLIRFPKKWRHLAPMVEGGVSDRLVSLMDLGPSVLSLAGAPIPAAMDGRAFLGPAAAPAREYMVFTRDRMDERVDFIRAVRDARYRYVRNFLPRVPAFPWLTYMEALESSKAFRRLQTSGHPGRFEAFLSADKPAEELYDMEADPNEFTNLADDPAHRKELERMRGRLAEWMLTTRDSGFLPEQQMMDAEKEAGSIRAWCADESRYPLKRLVAGDLPLGDPHPVVRFHAAQRHADREQLRGRLAVEKDADVRVALAWSLGDLKTLREVLIQGPAWSRTLALNAIDTLGEVAAPLRDEIQRVADQPETAKNRNQVWLARRVLTTLPSP